MDKLTIRDADVAGKRVFVRVVVDDVLVRIEHRHVHVLDGAITRGEDAIATPHLAAERVARDGILLRLVSLKDR